MEFEGCCRVNVDGLHWQLPQMKDDNPIVRLNISNVHFSSVSFLFYVGDNALLMFWWGVGTKTTWLGLGKDHVLSAQSRLETVSHLEMLKHSLYCSHLFVHDLIHIAEFHWDTNMYSDDLWHQKQEFLHFASCLMWTRRLFLYFSHPSSPNPVLYLSLSHLIYRLTSSQLRLWVR